MRFASIICLALLSACGEPERNPLDVDNDGDGLTEFEGDCDDSDPNTVNDMDCDGVWTADDCDDLDPNTVNDMDCDGTLTADDCDDNNPLSETVFTDGDCDGVLSMDDCDDADPTTINDMDCDGVLAVDDCDDSDPATVNDMDCDGILGVYDCDDLDPNTVNDMDCDGVLAVDDCDDDNPLSETVFTDADCDGVLTAYDCDDGDASTVYDMDCDGILSADDCDDLDPNSLIRCRLSCLDILKHGENIPTSTSAAGNGIYEIGPKENRINVYCDMTSNGGGWTWVANGINGMSSFSDWIKNSELNISNSGDPHSTWHLSNAQINSIVTEGEYRGGCSWWGNEYYFSNVSSYSWTSVTTADTCNTEYDQTGLNYSTSWSSCHKGLSCVGPFNSSHCDNGSGGITNPWACDSTHNSDISLWAR